MIINVMSYNIFLENVMIKKRLNSLLLTIKKYDPHILCLQEVRKEFVPILKDIFKDIYNFSNIIEKNYGSIILSKFFIKSCLIKNYKYSKMNRQIILIQVNVNNIDIVFVTTHCESSFKLNNFCKKNQYQECTNLLNKYYNKFKNVIVLGDFNVIENDEEFFIDSLDNNFIDLWKEFGNEKNKYTFNSETNFCLQACNKKFYKSRPDRILYKCCNFKGSNFELVKGIKGYCEPSDHYGIYGSLKIFVKTYIKIP